MSNSEYFIRHIDFAYIACYTSAMTCLRVILKGGQLVPISEKDREFMEQVAVYFRETRTMANPEGSIRDTAIHFGINRNKVRKILITTGDITSPLTEKAKALKNQGMSVDAIAQKLGVSTATVSIYLPYDDAIRDSLDPSEHALAVRNYRAYEREQAERQVQKRPDREAERMDASWKDEWKKEVKLSYTETDTRPSRMTWDDAEELKQSIDFSDVREMFEERERMMAETKKAEQAEIDELRAQESMTEEQKERLFELETKYGLFAGALVHRSNEALEAVSGERLPYEPREVIRLHMELIDDPEDDSIFGDAIECLKKYGNVKYGRTISRDVVVPRDIPLYAIHYLIQRLFGFQNSHLHKFELPKDKLLHLTENKAGVWSDLVGIVFRSPYMDEDAEFWADDYESGSFKNWLTRKYTGPYLSQCYGEGYVASKRSMRHYPAGDAKCYVLFVKYDDGQEYPRVVQPVYDKNGKKNAPPEARWLQGEIRTEIMNFDDVPIDALPLTSERGCFDLLERLPLECVMGTDTEEMSGSEMISWLSRYIIKLERSGIDGPDSQVFPIAITESIYYNYDFGDNWTIKITAMDDCRDLVEQGRITQEQIDRAQIKCRELYRPVTLAVDGEMLMDDVGGIHGFTDFLRTINPDLSGLSPEEKESARNEKKEMLAWAKGVQNWKKLSPMI